MKKLLFALLTLISTSAFALSSVTDKDFESKVLKSKGLVVVEVSTPNCPYCAMYAPVIESASTKLKSKAAFYNLTVDGTQNLKTGRYLGIEGFPTTLIFQNGSPIYAFTGATIVERELITSLTNTFNNADALQANVEKMTELQGQIRALGKQNHQLVSPEAEPSPSPSNGQ